MAAAASALRVRSSLRATRPRSCDSMTVAAASWAACSALLWRSLRASTLATWPRWWAWMTVAFSVRRAWSASLSAASCRRSFRATRPRSCDCMTVAASSRLVSSALAFAARSLRASTLAIWPRS